MSCFDVYLLDTHIASDAIKGNPARVRERLVSLPMRSVTVSAVTQGELIYGLAKRGNPAALGGLIHEFLIRVEVLPWTAEVATVYGALRASCAKRGVSLSALDMMIAAQAVTTSAVLVTRDKAFDHVEDGLKLENWT
ncbi:MAG TPA: type II toxin-antitoxin system VapC family toxin [Steroidobacteraceae bacterium]|nr:type II toxin-antitoxin system VapC family toxin [Steroidobacteraceae bacterium]